MKRRARMSQKVKIPYANIDKERGTCVCVYMCVWYLTWCFVMAATISWDTPDFMAASFTLSLPTSVFSRDSACLFRTCRNITYYIYKNRPV